MSTARTTFSLGLAQLISWGISYYLIGGFGERIAADLGWTRNVVYGGFSLALMVMGLISPIAGRLIDAYGGRLVMVAGSLLNALGCVGLALAEDVPSYYAAWICLGVAMRLTLYDAAFAALARIDGPDARRAMSQITLLGGLASTTFWPLGHFLAGHFGWRGAVLAYAGFALLTVPLHLAIPNGRHEGVKRTPDDPECRPPASSGHDITIKATLYAVIVTLTNFLNAGMGSHMILILAGLGLGASASVWIGSLRGIGQSMARLCEVMFGHRIHPLTLNLLAAGLLPFCFVAGLFGGQFTPAAFVFAFVYGAGNGLLTITRGTLPLVLFDYRTYGAFVGRLIVPSFMLSAAAPLIYAVVIGRFGETGALFLSAALATVILVAAAFLMMRSGREG